MSLIDGLISWWELDEASGNRVDSHGGNPFAPTSAPGNAAGVDGGLALALNGTTQRLSRNSLTLGSAYSFGCWIRPSNLTGLHTLFAQRSLLSAIPIHIRFYTSNVKLDFDVRPDGGTQTKAVFDGVTLAVNTWYFAVAVRDGDVLTVYLDGVAGTPVTASSPIGTITTASLDLGSNFSGSATRVDFFEGRIDKAFAYNRALSGAEITELYNGGSGLTYAALEAATGAASLAGSGSLSAAGRRIAVGGSAALAGTAAITPDGWAPLESMISWWEMEETGTRFDSHGGNSLASINSVARGNGFGGGFAAQFNGTNQRLNRAAITLGTSYTFGAWIFPTSLAATHGIFCQRSTALLQPISSRLVCNTTDLIYTVRDDSGNQALATKAGLTLDAWNFVVGVRSGNTTTAYINAAGGTPATAPATIGTITPNQIDLGSTFGASTTRTDFFAGRIDKAFCYARALRPSEIAALYNGGSGRTYQALSEVVARGSAHLGATGPDDVGPDCSLDGISAVELAGMAVAEASASLAGTATIAAIGEAALPIVSRAAHLAGTAAIGAEGSIFPDGAAHLAGTCAIAAAGYRVLERSAHLAGTGSIVAEGRLAPIADAAAEFAGTCAVEVVGKAVAERSVALAGTCAIAAAGGLGATSREAMFAATAEVTADARTVMAGSAILAGTATVAADGGSSVRRSATLAGTARIGVRIRVPGRTGHSSTFRYRNGVDPTLSTARLRAS